MNPALEPGFAPARSPTLIGVGGVAWTGDPRTVYSTLLGSCIAVCFFDPVAERGGMNHFLLAEAPSPQSADTRYGEVSLRVLVDTLCMAGCRRERLRAVVAGGADLLSNMKPIGTENSEFALAWLRREGITISDKNYGGTKARRVRFVPTTGQCQITQVDNEMMQPSPRS
jgi:chemotaxis protein CheD